MNTELVSLILVGISTLMESDDNMNSVVINNIDQNKISIVDDNMVKADNRMNKI